MKLLFVDFELPQLLKDAEFPGGGWAVQLRQLLIGLAQAGHHSGVLTWRGANAYVGAQSVCDLVETYDPARGIPKLKHFTNFLPALYSAARAYRPDVILQSCANVQTGTMALVARGLGIPFVHRIANDIDADGRNAQYLNSSDRIGFRYGLKNSCLVICQNSYQLEHIRRRFPVKPAGVIHNAIRIPDSVENLARRTERNYVAWLATFARRKNLPLLLEVAKSLPEVEFRIAGALPGEAAHAPTLLALDELKRLKNVTFLGYLRRDQVWEFLNGATALLSTSDFEGFSNTILESLAVGTPVVLRSNIDPDAIIGENDLGLVAHNEHDLVRCVREICAMNADHYESVRQRCRNHVETHHTPIAAVSKLISILEPVVQRSSWKALPQ